MWSKSESKRRSSDTKRRSSDTQGLGESHDSELKNLIPLLSRPQRRGSHALDYTFGICPMPGTANTCEQDMKKRVRNNLKASQEKLTTMGPSERIETKAKTLKRLTFDKDAFELALTKPCLRFSKAIDTLLSYCDARQKLDPLLPQSALSGYGSWTSRSVEVLECDVLKWRNGLSDLLTDEKGQQAFAKFLKSEYSGENLSFWLHTRRYRRAPINSHRRIARVIYDKHISEDCGEPVNLPQRESSTILNALESEQALNRFLFDDAAEHIFKLMKTDSYKRFLNSAVYQDLLDVCKVKL